ncbi:hypothetical protein MRX96_041764 [Rhipicephalus microplus]
MGYLEMAKWFDENLYTELTPPSADFSFVRNDQLFEFCDSPVVEEDLFAALSTRKRTRSPGSDVLTVKFHIKLWKVLGKPFTPLNCLAYSCGATEGLSGLFICLGWSGRWDSSRRTLGDVWKRFLRRSFRSVVGARG